MGGIGRSRTLSLGPPAGTEFAINMHETPCPKDEPKTGRARVVEVLGRSLRAFVGTVTARTDRRARQAQAAARLTPAGQGCGYVSP